MPTEPTAKRAGRPSSFNEATSTFPTTIPVSTQARVRALVAHRTIETGARVNMNAVVNEILVAALDKHDAKLAKRAAKSGAKSAPEASPAS